MVGLRWQLIQRGISQLVMGFFLRGTKVRSRVNEELKHNGVWILIVPIECKNCGSQYSIFDELDHIRAALNKVPGDNIVCPTMACTMCKCNMFVILDWESDSAPREIGRYNLTEVTPLS